LPRLQLEQLEDRTLPSGVPNDPLFANQYALQNTGQTGGTPGADIHAPAAWSVATGSRSISVAVIDTGIDYNHPDLYANVWLNVAEIPLSRLKNLIDADGDGIITFADLQDPRNQGPGKITDLNHDGRIDAGDILQPMIQDAQGNDTGLGGWAYPGNTQDGDTAHPNDFIGWNFVANTNDPLDDHGHGTNMAGVIGAIGNNGTGVAGIAWQSSLMAIKALDSHGNGTASWLIGALQYARLHGAKILNNSWGDVGNWPNMLAEINAEQQAGEIFVSAAGNGARNIDLVPEYPSSFPVDNIVAVAATDANDNLANFSNYGPNTVALAAPGVGIVSTYPGKSYNQTTGTSVAAPMVSGVLALVWGQHPDWSYRQVIDQVLSTVDKLPSLQGKVSSGGRLDAAAAVGASTNPSSPPPTPVPPPPVPPPMPAGAPFITGSALLGGPNMIVAFRVTFSKPVDPGSFSPDDVFFYDPSGRQIAARSVTLVAGSNNTVFDIVLPAQTAAGVYSLKIGPEVFDSSWNKMVVYRTTFTLGGRYTVSSPTRLAIPTLGRATSAVVFSQNLQVVSVSVNVNLTFPNAGSLVLHLLAPDGTDVVLANQRGAGAGYQNTTFADGAATSITAGAAPFAGTYRPESPLSGLAGKSASGVWKLLVENKSSGGTGTLDGWSLTLVMR
jgi:subtilisin family serine protease/subtilisin-like proprotein convertase family protein